MPHPARIALVLLGAHLPFSGAAAAARPGAELGAPLASAAAGAWAGWTLGVDGGLGPPALSAPAGAALGAGLDLWLRRTPPTAGAGARTLSLSAHGAYFGRQMGRMMVPFHVVHAASVPAQLSAVGDAVGLGLALALPAPHAWSPGAWWTVTGGTAAGHLGGAALATAVGLDTQVGRQGRAAIEASSAVVGGGLAAGVTRMGWTKPDPLAPLVVGGHAAWVGAWTPRALGIESTEARIRGGAAGGAALGWTIGSLSPWGPETPAAAASGVAWAVAGTALARGPIDTWAPASADPAATQLMLLGGALGNALGAAWAPRYEGGGAGQGMLLGGGQLLAAAQAGTWGVVADQQAQGAPEDRARRRMGAGLTAYGLTAAATLSTPMWVAVEPTDALLVGGCAAWGGWLGAGGGLALGAPAGPHAAATGTGAALGLAVGTALLAAPGTWASHRQFTVHGGGLVGAGMGAAVAGLTQHTSQAAAAGGLLGSAAGAGAALWRTRPGAPPLWQPRRDRTDQNADYSEPNGKSSPHPRGGGRLQRLRSACACSWSLAPWSPPRAAPTGVAIELSGRH